MTWTVDAAEEDFKKKSEILVKNPFTISNVNLKSGTVVFGQDIDLDIRFTKGTDLEFRPIRALNCDFFFQPIRAKYSESNRKLLTPILLMYTVILNMQM